MARAMKPAFSYYGGKQRMSKNIIPLIPKHTVYVEPFAGGAAIFFRKPWPKVANTDTYREVLNDTNKQIVNFYQQLRDNGEALALACELTPYSRVECKEARKLTGDSLEDARRWFANISMSFAYIANKGWGTGVFHMNPAVTFQNSAANLYECARRLRGVHIECDDAINVIKRWDSPQTFFYCDPPYPGTSQGHYDGYTSEDFDALVSALDSAQGSFLLSCYDQPNVPDSWTHHEFSTRCSASGKGKAGSGRDKTKAATDLGDRKRTEVAWSRTSTVEPREEILKLYRSGAFDCFTGETLGGDTAQREFEFPKK